jgi:hypothetical protein
MEELYEKIKDVYLIYDFKIDYAKDFIDVSIIYEQTTIFHIHIYQDYFVLQNIKRSTSEENISLLLKKSVILARKIEGISKVRIGGDNSMIYFQTENKTTTIELELINLNLLAYGKSWYNRIGFGTQSSFWEDFISKPLIPFLQEINFNDIENEFLAKYKECTIQETFSDIISDLKIITIRKDKNINVVFNSTTEYLLFVENIMYSIYDVNEKNKYLYVPEISQNTDYFL